MADPNEHHTSYWGFGKPDTSEEISWGGVNADFKFYAVGSAGSPEWGKLIFQKNSWYRIRFDYYSTDKTFDMSVQSMTAFSGLEVNSINKPLTGIRLSANNDGHSVIYYDDIEVLGQYCDWWVFRETWETGSIDPNRWKQFGSPAPIIQNLGHNSNYSLDTNGDANYQSGVVTLRQFVWKPGTVVSVWVNAKDTSFTYWHHIVFRLGNTEPGNTDERKQPCVACFDWCYETSSSNRRFQAVVKRDSGNTVLRKEDRTYLSFSEWHLWQIEIVGKRHVRFWVDGQLFAESTEVDLSRGKGPIIIDGRSYIDPHYIDDVTVYFNR